MTTQLELWRRVHADGMIADVVIDFPPRCAIEIRRHEGSVVTDRADDLTSAKEQADTLVATMAHTCSDACGLWRRIYPGSFEVPIEKP